MSQARSQQSQQGTQRTKSGKASIKLSSDQRQKLKTSVARALKKRVVTKDVSNNMVGPFTGVAEMSQAPVSIGNTLRSTRPTAVQTANSVLVTGRDFVMAVAPVGNTYTGWTLAAGFPLSPAALNASSLRGYFQSYERFRFRRAVVHYITSSPTSSSGDILILHHTNRGGPKVDHSSSNFLSYAMSTDAAILGPQWVNHSIEVITTGPLDWCETDIFNSEDLQHQANGEVLVYTKETYNGAAASPGYILIDYQVEFHNRMLNPRVQTLPSALLKYFNGNFNANGAPVIGDPAAFAVTGVNTYAGTAGTAPPGATAGDIYQIVLDLTNPTLVGAATIANMFSTIGTIAATAAYVQPTRQPFPLTNGGTYFACWDGSVMVLFANYDACLAGVPCVWTAAGAQQLSCPCIYSLVGSRDNTYAQANIG
jgi:hypothetical protein